MNFDENDLSSYSRRELEVALLMQETKLLRLVAMYDDAILALEACRDMICKEVADGQYTEQADRAIEILKQADALKNEEIR